MDNRMIKKLLNSISTRSGAAKLALGVVIILIILKVIVSIISNSISITAQATDSFLDIFSIGITIIAVRMSVQPADEEHPFGHGKMEGGGCFGADSGISGLGRRRFHYLLCDTAHY